MHDCTMGVCHRCWGAKLAVIGLLIIVNAYQNIVAWPVFVGGLFVLLGLVKLIMPGCGHCKEHQENPVKRKR